MLTARRLYLYGVLIISLGLLLVGLRDLLQLLGESLARGASGVPRLSREQMDRETLSRALAMVLVAGPLWAVHWWLLGRTLRGSDDVADTERASAARGVFFLLVLLGTLVASFAGLSQVLSRGLRILAGHPAAHEGLPLGSAVSAALVFGFAWMVHAWWRNDDLRRVPSRLARDWTTRLYLYGVLFVAAIVVLVQAAAVIGTVLQVIAARPPAGEGTGWWRVPAAGATATMVVAGLGWFLHWGYGRRLLTAPDPMGPAHREARTRTAYFLGVVLVGVVAVVTLAANALRVLLTWVMGGPGLEDGRTVTEDVVGPLMASLPFALAWWWHQRRGSIEALAFGGHARLVGVQRAARAIVAFVGLAAMTGGMSATLLSLMRTQPRGARLGIESATAGGADLAGPIAAILVGVALWAPAWFLLQQRRAADPRTEAVSTGRRAYLLFVSGVSIIVAMATGAWLVYQALRTFLEAGRDGNRDDPALAISVLIVAVAVLAYHLLALRADMAVAHLAHGTASAAVDAGSPGAIGAVAVLELTGPSDTDFETIVAALGERLPAGLSLRVVPPEPSAPADVP